MKWVLGVIAVALTTTIIYRVQDRSRLAQDLGSRYPRVEVYEIRPDILATPTYTRSGALCQISVEKRHVEKNAVDLSGTIPHAVVRELIDELAPPYERGESTLEPGAFNYDIISGSMVTTPIDYRNVSVEIDGLKESSGATALILRWKNVCDPDQVTEQDPK